MANVSNEKVLYKLIETNIMILHPTATSIVIAIGPVQASLERSEEDLQFQAFVVAQMSPETNQTVLATGGPQPFRLKSLLALLVNLKGEVSKLFEKDPTLMAHYGVFQDDIDSNSDIVTSFLDSNFDNNTTAGEDSFDGASSESSAITAIRRTTTYVDKGTMTTSVLIPLKIKSKVKKRDEDLKEPETTSKPSGRSTFSQSTKLHTHGYQPPSVEDDDVERPTTPRSPTSSHCGASEIEKILSGWWRLLWSDPDNAGGRFMAPLCRGLGMAFLG
ncbi:uncharacterized protein K452DRAFT_312440 [Aplosporella prunicola CBS 121167]|uniref:Uncharacterized protein n=1 Tax=Aplosporella prunicola CBS 121167 TaxID=1176127 RepID=A0A6A6B211_9PEZI|nr:uncharacterized protein K452DRAFT_312440 [Aplosporella prunicola CBS 121167]KAF2137264.1 hypothetical protein K452DRAFT_312440 [Aplosporella prunicola CBS 121167]